MATFALLLTSVIALGVAAAAARRAARPRVRTASVAPLDPNEVVALLPVTEREREVHPPIRDLARLAPAIAAAEPAQVFRKERTRSGRIEVEYELNRPELGVGISSSLNVEPEVALAEQFLQDTVAAEQASLSRNGLRRVDCSHESWIAPVMSWGAGRSCSLIQVGRHPVGLSLIVQKGRRAYQFQAWFEGVGAQREAIGALLASRLAALEAYEP